MKIENELLVDRDFSASSWSNFVSIGSSFDRCDFRGVRSAQMCFGGGATDSIYTRCRFDEASFGAKVPGNARFVECSFLSTTFTEFNGRNIEFINCIFSGDIRKGYLTGSTSDEMREALGRASNEVRGNDFSSATIGDFGFRGGVDLSNQRLPLAAHYLYLPDAARTCAAVRDAHSSSLEAGTPLETLLAIFERDIRMGQRQLFFNTEAFPQQFRKPFATFKEFI